LVGVGFARELGMSEPLIASLIVRALRESAAMGVAAGGLEKTFYGLAGIGDLMAAMAQQDARPEVAFGRKLAKGAHASQLAAESGVRIESVELVPRVLAFARNRGIHAPVFETLATILDGKASLSEITAALMRP
jgi:glycerol-3-phosphate dehydrogenase (NAD(P)+)